MEETIKSLEQQLKNLVDEFKNELAGVRTNRPTPKLIEDIKVDYYNQLQPLKQLGAISIIPPREISVAIWDKGAVAAVVKAIEMAKLGLSVNVDGNVLHINLPPLTDERRKELEKLVKSLTEKERIKVRMMRDEINKKNKALTDEDVRFRQQKKVQELVDGANKQLEDLLSSKVKEINA